MAALPEPPTAVEVVLEPAALIDVVVEAAAAPDSPKTTPAVIDDDDDREIKELFFNTYFEKVWAGPPELEGR